MNAGPRNNSAPAPPARRTTGRRFDLRRHGLVVAGALAALVAADVVWRLALIRPLQRDLQLRESGQAQSEDVEKKTGQELAETKEVYEKVKATERNIERFFREMLATKEARLVPFQSALIKVGQEFNVLPEKVAVSSNELEEEGIEAIAFSFPLVGGYENLRRFLARLESLDQFLIVRQVGLSGAREGGQTLQLSIECETFFNAPEIRTRMEAERKAKAAEARGSGRRRTGRR